MGILAHAVTSFFASSGFAVLFNAPRKSLFPCGVVGMLGWLVHIGLVELHFLAVPATVIASIAVGVLSRMSAVVFKKPILIFYVAGIIPLVPGGVSYNAMRSFIESDYFGGVELAAEVLILSGGIAIGLIFSEVMNQFWKKVRGSVKL